LQTLDESTVGDDPVKLFLAWFEAAFRAGGKEPSAMTLATADAGGAPSARMVLLKGCDQRGFVFFTNYDSRKGAELERNPQAALVFHWPEMNRQVRIRGRVAKVSDEESDEYFETRPLGSRWAAAASPQSASVASRRELEQRYAEVSAKYPAGNVPRPKNWGGYRVQPEEIEFWHSRENRLHDRIRFQRRGDGAWQVDRLAP
jgi:pyridoxamine 5'-phosphate oxidase